MCDFVTSMRFLAARWASSKIFAAKLTPTKSARALMVDQESPQRGAPALACTVTPVTELTATERARLFDLMSSHFDHVDRSRFFADLDEKPSVLLVREPASARICGFSTITLFEMTHGTERVAAVFA